MDTPKPSEKKQDAVSAKSPGTFSPGALFSAAAKLGRLFQNFTPAQQLIGIDIGSSYIKILQLKKTPKGYVIVNCVTRALPFDDDPARKKSLIQDIVKQFIADSRVKTNVARCALSGKGIFVFSLTVPQIGKKDLRGLVSLELKKRLPFQLDINNVTFDYFVTGQVQEEKGVSLQLTCIAVDRLNIDEQVNFLKEVNVRVVGVYVIPDALGNLVSSCLNPKDEKTKEDRTITLLDFGANTSQLNFYRGKNLIFSREIPIGGEHLTRAMAKPITTSSATVEITVDDAEKIKRNCGIPLEDEAKVEYLTDFGVMIGEQISTMLRPILERLILEITRTISYYSKTFKTEEIRDLYLTGGSSRLRNIDKFFLYNLERMRKVERLDILKSVKGWAETGVLKQELVMEQAAPHLAVAFGLSLGDGGKVNLLPMKERLEQKTLMPIRFMKVFFPVIIVLTVLFFLNSYLANKKYISLIKKFDKEIGRLESAAQGARGFLELKARLDQRKELLDKAKGRQPLLMGILKELSAIIPSQAVLTKVEIFSKDQVKEIRLTGKIVSKYTNVELAISQFCVTLEESPFFEDVEPVKTEKDAYSAVPAATFEIVGKLVY